MQRQEEIVEYMVQTDINISRLKEKYPNIIIRTVTPGIYAVGIPNGDETIVKGIREQVGYIVASKLYGLNANEALQASNILTFHDYPFGELRGTGTLIAIVDTGIDYTNNLFRYEDGSTRIVSIWDQTIESNQKNDLGFGTIYTEEQINEALKSSDPYSIVPSRDEIGHGTFLAGVAAGKDRTQTGTYTGAAPEARLIVVKLKQGTDRQKIEQYVPLGTPAYPDGNILLGFSYVVQKSTEIAQPLALLVGIGNNYGNHGGSTIMAGFLETLTIYPGVVVVVAAGNEGNTGHHFYGKIDNGGKLDIEVNITQGEEGVNISLWTVQADQVSISLISPIGQSVERVPLKPYKSETVNFTLQETVVTVIYDYPNINTGGQNVIINIEAPITGIWTISVYGDYIINGNFNVWLPRDGFIKSATRFSQPNSNITLSSPATGDETIVVGGYDYIDGSVYAASGRGPTTKGIIKPDLIAPAVNVDGPSLAGGLTTYIGTSTAAAITAGAVALLLEWGIVKKNLPTMNTRIARVMLIRGANRKRGVEYPNPIEGYGKLDLKNSLALF